LKSYLKLKNIFLYQASTSSYPTISMNDAITFAKESEFMDNNVNLSCLDRLFIASNVPGAQNQWKDAT
jgi:hypothetical protein